MAEDQQEAVKLVLDCLHMRASEANFEGYFALFSPNAVFIGTDAKERWDLTSFKAYVKQRFDAGHGWTYTARERHVFVGVTENFAWFDEMLDNRKYGLLCRGSGVLVKYDMDWKICQYHLTIPIPNDLVETVGKLIDDHDVMCRTT